MAETNHIKNLGKTVESTAKEIITDLVSDLVKNNVVNLEEEEKKKFNEAKHRDKAWVFVDSLRKKHKKAGQMFLQAFFNLNEETNYTDVQHKKEIGLAEPAESTETLKYCPPEKFCSMCTESSGKIYPIRERNDRTRLALIICNTKFEHLSERNGAHHDITGMKELLQGLDYTVETEENLTAKEMELVLWNFATRETHKSSDSTFLVFMSHGTLHGIYGTSQSDNNSDVLRYDTIFEIFNSHNCPGLKGKPKVMIVQACRGEKVGETWATDSAAALETNPPEPRHSLKENAVYTIPVEKDFIAFYSTTPHNRSWRDKTQGSFFIRELIACFKKYSWCDHLEEIFRKVQQSFEIPDAIAQMPTIDPSSLTKYFYLFPGN